jgi:hypothetical protein
MSFNFLGRVAIVVALAAAMTSSSAVAGEINAGSQNDPNFPPAYNAWTVDSIPIYWTGGYANRPDVHFKGGPLFPGITTGGGEYLGFNEKGSLIRNEDGKVYYWNFKQQSLTLVANSYKEVPLDVFASLQNAPQSVQYWLEKNRKAHHGAERDPNLPPLVHVTAAPLYWSYGSGTTPLVQFKNPQSDALYLGFNENGSLIRNQGNGKIYYWKLMDPKAMTGSLTVAANSYQEVSNETFESLRNPGVVTRDKVEMIRKAAHPAPTPPPPPPPPSPDKSGGLFGSNPRSALQGLAPAAGAPAAGSPADIVGKNASIQAGVLTFTLPDGSRSKPYTVVRPTFMASAPQATGVTGTWVAMQSGGKGMMFNVLADNSLTGKEISPQVVQMLMQGAPKSR